MKRNQPGSVCTRCRRLKVKCIVKTGHSKCMRCARAHHICDLPTRGYASNSNSNHITTTPESSTSNEVRETDWPAHIIRNATINTLIELELMNTTELNQMYQLYISSMSQFLTITLDEPSLEKNSEYEPITTIAMVISARFNTPAVNEKIDLLSVFLERLIYERIFIENECSLDIVKALFVIIMYTPVFKEPKLSLFATTTYTLATTLNVGNIHDCKEVINNSENNKTAVERTKAFIILTTMIRAMGINTYRPVMSKIVDKSLLPIDALKSCPTISVTTRLQLMLSETVVLANEIFYQLQDLLSNQLHPSAVKDLLNKFDNRRKESYKNAELLLTNSSIASLEKDQKYLRILNTIYAAFSLSLHESAMGQILFSKYPIDRNIVKQFVLNVKNAAETSIKFFLDRSKSDIAPRFVYSYPVVALCALIRIRIVCWSWMLDTTQDEGEFDINVDYWFDQCYNTWVELKDHSAIASRLMYMLEKVRKWKNLQLFTSTNNDLETANSLQQLIKDVMLVALNDDHHDQSNNNNNQSVGAARFLTTPTSKPAAAPELPTVLVEDMLRELFGDNCRMN